jgi:uncharacterized membrane protein YdbT with pleckstrin-like domain
MNQIPEILGTKEKIIWTGVPRYAPYIISAIMGSLIVALFVGLFSGSFFKNSVLGLSLGCVVLVLGAFIGHLAYGFTQYALTSRRVIIQTGIFGRSFKSIEYDDIKNSSVQKGLFNWLFGTGTINIFTGEMQSSGGKNSQLKPKYDSFRYVSDAYDILKKLQENTTVMEEDMYGGKNVVQKVKVVK